MAGAAEEQRQQYNKHSEERSFKVDDPVWLSISTAGKLDPRWEGNWVVTGCKSPVNVEISEGARRRVVHMNRIRHPFQPAKQLPMEDALTVENQGGPLHWQAPQVDHEITCQLRRTSQKTYLFRSQKKTTWLKTLRKCLTGTRLFLDHR